MEIRFRVKTIKWADQSLHYIPESCCIPAEKPFAGDRPTWNAIGQKAYDTPEEAIQLIKDTRTLWDNQDVLSLPELTVNVIDSFLVEHKSHSHCFTEIRQILEYCKSLNITDDYLIQGLENSIKKNYYITKVIGGGGIMG
jgi:hypothetical protein